MLFLHCNCIYYCEMIVPFISGYEFADDDYDLDENEKSEGAKQAGDDSSGVLNIANGEIKKLTEEIAPKEKVATPPVQKVTPPLEPITEHSDEADKSIPTTKPGKRLKPYGNEIAIYHQSKLLSLCNNLHFI